MLIDDSLVFQRRALRIRARTLRYKLPRQRERHVILHGSSGGYRGPLRRSTVPRVEERWHPLARSGWDLAFCFRDGVLTCGDEESTDVLIQINARVRSEEVQRRRWFLVYNR